MKKLLSALTGLSLVVLAITTVYAATFPDNFADVNGTYVQKNNQGIVKKKFRVTGFKSFVQVEKLDLNDGSVLGKGGWAWTNYAPLSFGKANVNQQRLKEITRGATPPFNLTKEVYDVNGSLIKSVLWEKESS